MILYDIPNRDGYKISRSGRVFSCMSTGCKPTKTNKWKELKPCTRNGYLNIGLGRRFGNIAIHKLVAMTFLGPCPKGMEIRHFSGTRNNNRASNLRYGTRSDNCLDTVRHGRCNLRSMPGSNHPMAVLTESIVFRIKRDSRKLKILARKYGVSMSTISLIRTGKAWRHVK